jgi:SAM-dependent methyltransferase
MLTAVRRAVRQVFAHHPFRTRLGCRLCTEAQLRSPTFRRWLAEMRQPYRPHRKFWEWAYIAQALHERGVLRPGARGLGFAVGAEPLAAVFAARGCAVVATDLDPGTADLLAARWLTSGQHATSYDLLNARGICPADEFARRVQLRYVDMNAIPDDLTGFDFVWSSCSLEHLGSLEHGMRFLENMARCLRPGGVAVHTTEFNVLSDHRTIEAGGDVLFRRRDIEEIADRLAAVGCRLAERDYHAGDSGNDWKVDMPPYQFHQHLKLDYAGYVITSIGLIATKG